jgi:hypothetical protein
MFIPENRARLVFGRSLERETDEAVLRRLRNGFQPTAGPASIFIALSIHAVSRFGR